MGFFNGIRNFFKRAESVPKDFNDPLAAKISWEPMAPGGTNFRTHKVIMPATSRIEFEKTKLMKVFPWIFILAPYIIFIIIFCTKVATKKGGLIFNDNAKYLMIPGIVCLVFTAVGIYMLNRFNKSIVFDKVYGYYWKGKHDPSAMNDQNSKHFVKLDQIYALQIISEHIQSNKSSYRSYELNLVLKTGERVNVIDHGNLNALRNDAQTISTFLAIPVWDNT